MSDMPCGACRNLSMYGILLPPSYPTGGGVGLGGHNLKVAKHKVLKSISESNYHERLHCKYIG